MSYLLDTNVLSELVRPKPNKEVIKWFHEVPDNALYLSVLTLGEIRKGIENIRENHRKQKLKLWLEHELPEWFENRILSIDNFVADRWGRLEKQAKRTLPVIDSLIAATALHYDLAIVTRNESDFKGFSLEVINPWKD
jgi:predicted nucleic acid-binding protein